jgi:multidrug efflux pump subunit AcrB
MGVKPRAAGGVVLIGTIALNIWMYITIPKTFFPEQDTGILMGGIQADQSISFQAMRIKLQDFMKIIRDDPAVDNVTGFTGGSRVNSGMMFITLKARSVAMKPPSRLSTGCEESSPKSRGPVSFWWRFRISASVDGIQCQLSVHAALRRS